MSEQDYNELKAQYDELMRESSNYKSAVEGSGTAIITCDRDLIITYVNPASIRLLQQNLDTFRQAFPGFDPTSLLGSNLDRFHTNPQYQRSILSNPANLPHTADIQVGDLTFELNICALTAANGEYIGCSLEWQNVTESRAAQKKAASLYSMVENVETNLMFCNLERVITYCNPAVTQLLSTYEMKLRQYLPNFSVANLVGTCIDQFHANPALQRRLCEDPRNFPYKTEITVGDMEFGLNAMALMDENNNYVGVAVEWLDINARAQYRNEVNNLLTAAKSGDLSYRGDVSKLDDFYKPMLQGINDLIEAFVKPILEIADCLKSISSGDMTSYVMGEYGGDYDKLKGSLNSTLDNLNKVLLQAYESSGQTAKGAAQVSDSSQAISQGATELAASLEEITASMNEISSQTKQNAESAGQASDLAKAAQNGADQGNELMGRMLTAMADIDNAAQKINKIIKVIDEIAFQTNLLALNAAVEAARAGVHGKGFAVVAEEVRNLAARSADAARETTDLIEGSIRKVQAGTNVAKETSESLQKIVEDINKVTGIMEEIAGASHEQAQGIGQVNQGLIQLDQVTQQNTANAEESAAASIELSEQVNQLSVLLQQFKLKKQEMPSVDLSQLPPDILAQLQEMLGKKNGNGPGSAARPAPKRSPMSPAPHEVIPLDDVDFGSDMGRY